MKLKPAFIGLVLACALAAGCTAPDDFEAVKAAARKGVVPPAFFSEDAAQTYVRAFQTGGRVDSVRIGLRRYLVVFTHGSGRPVIGIAVYRRTDWHWELVAQPRPPLRDFLRAATAEGKIFGVEERSGQRVMLYDPDEKKG